MECILLYISIVKSRGSSLSCSECHDLLSELNMPVLLEVLCSALLSYQKRTCFKVSQSSTDFQIHEVM